MWLIALAAAVAAVGLLILVPQGIVRYQRARADQLEKELAVIPKQRQERVAELQRAVRQERMQLGVTGPSSLQAGATNTYMIETKSLAGDSIAAKLSLRLLDKAGKEIAREEKQTESGKLAYSVPTIASLKPDDQITLEVTATRQGTNQESVTVTETLPLERASFVTHVTTDKPLYQPGEVVSFRSLTLDRVRLQPSDEDLQLVYTITDPSGQTVYRSSASAVIRDPRERGRLLQGPDGRTLRGVGFGEFAIPGNAVGGEYVLSVGESRSRFAPQTRKFLVNRYQAPRLHKELEFTRRSYGPGDEVLAAGRVRRIEGGKPLAEQTVSATIIVDGERLRLDGARSDAPISLKTDAEGNVAVRFKLPKTIQQGDASLSLAFTDGGNSETIVRSIPIVVRRLRVDFYPEGGDLIAGQPNRVYFAVRTPLGKPAEMAGRVLVSKGQTVADIRTLGDEKTPEANHGLGAFTFTPAAGQKYELQIDSPVGIPYKVDLPLPKPDGVVLTVETGRVSGAEPIKATVRSVATKRKLLVAAFCRGSFVGSETVDVEANTAKSVAIAPSSHVGGVYRVTVYEDTSSASVAKLTPVAERLVYRHSPRYLDVAVQPDKAHYVPGEKVRLAVTAKDETGKAAGAIALVQVVDRAALSLADDKTLRAMPTHFLLTGEIKNPEELENADFLLSDHPLAVPSVDLLLGTQGWRRFAEQDPAKFREQYKSEADRFIATAGQFPLVVTNKREAEAAATPLLNEAKQKATNEFNEKSGDLAIVARNARKSAHDWQEIAEACSYLGLLGLVVVVVATLLMAVFALLSAAEQKTPGLAGTIFGIGGIFALVFVFALFAFMFVGDGLSLRGPKSTFSAVGASVGSSDRAFPPMPMAEGNVQASAGGRPAGPLGPPRSVDPAAPVPTEAASAGDTPSDERPSAATDPAYSSDVKKLGAGESARRRYVRVHQEQNQRPLEPVAPRTERSFKELARSNRAGVVAGAAAPLVIREYAHENQPGRTTRSDFTETVFWHPVLVIPAGETFVSFSLSDAITSYQALAIVHTTDGRLGSARIDLAARLPFSLDSKVPLEVTGTDELHLPVAVSNDSDRKREVQLSIDARGLTRLDGPFEARFDVAPDQRARAVFKYKPSVASGEARIVINGRSDLLTDRVERRISVVPEGFPIGGVKSGTLARELTANLVLPEHVTPGSLKVRAEVYPSVLADIQTGIEGMLREPHGCFEQTSSSNYPNLLVLDYLQSTNQSRPEVTRRALELLERGYARLLTFECQRPGGGREGFEWFGGYAPPHEALTAYGLMQFHDLARVYDRVSPAMVERTRKFLMSRRDGQGNFRRRQDYHRFGQVSQPVFNAYIAWALAESDADADLNREVQLLVQQSESSSDPYFLALVANTLLKRADNAAGAKLLDKLVKLQSPEGMLPGRESIVGSSGRDLAIEATALAVLAWMKSEEPMKFREPLKKAVTWLTAQRGVYGGFGSTQATVLTLKALANVARESAKLTPGSIVLTVNGDRLMQQEFLGSTQDVLVFELAERDVAKLKAGTNELRLEVTNDSPLPAKISWEYRSIQPPSAENCPVKLTTRLDKSDVKEGDTVRLTTTVENIRKEGVSMTVAVIGLPAGLAVPEDLKQLQQLTQPRTPLAGGESPDQPTISYFEVRGRELVLYWRGLDGGQKVDVAIDLIARTPGKYRGPASRAYLYYGADSECWVAPLAARITAK